MMVVKMPRVARECRVELRDIKKEVYDDDDEGVSCNVKAEESSGSRR